MLSELAHRRKLIFERALVSILSVHVHVKYANNVFVTHLFKFAANEAEGLEDCGGGAADGDDSLRARAIGNVDFGSRL